jgi:hypothetical protein
MHSPEADRPLTQEQRLEVFRALVEAQDGGMAVAESRKAVAGRFGISEHQVQHIEREGLDGLWPPLDLPPDYEAEEGPPAA